MVLLFFKIRREIETKVLVARGKGFIRSRLLNYLKAEGHWVRGVDAKRSSSLKNKEDKKHVREKE